MALYVDVDNTLVLWIVDGQIASTPTPYGRGSEMFVLNEALIDAIKRWQVLCPEERLVVWSGGGKDYAMLWAQRIFMRENDGKKLDAPFKSISAGHKDITMLRKGDIIVDDMNLGGLHSVKAFLPGDFVHLMETDTHDWRGQPMDRYAVEAVEETRQEKYERLFVPESNEG